MTINVIHTIASIDSNTGGPARSVTSLCRSLKKYNVDVSFLSCLKDHSSNYFEHSGIPSCNHKCSFLIGSDFEKRLRQLIQEQRNGRSIIHDHGIWLPNNHVVARTANKLRVPLVVSPRGMLSPWARKYKNFKKTVAWFLYQRRNLKKVTMFHATSVMEAKYVKSLGFHTPISVIPNGVDIPVSNFSARKPKGINTVLFLGRIHPVKGLDNFITAWDRIRPADWKVVIAGPDEIGHKNVLERQIRQRGLTNSFEFIGPLSDVEKWNVYQKADLFVLPSHTENFGIVVAEALASGIPVISTKGTPWVELEEHKCGWWIDIGVEPLANALKKAMDLTIEDRAAMGLRGRALIEQHYSWNNIARQMITVYEWVLEGGVPPTCVLRS